MALPRYFSTRGHLLVCTGDRCKQRGAAALFTNVWRRLEEERLAYYTYGGSIRLTESGCQGACEFGPNAIVYFPIGEGLADAWYCDQDERSLVAIARALHARTSPPIDKRYDPQGNRGKA